MKKILVFDLPTRIFHWLFAAGFLTAIFIGKTIDEESAVFPIHMMVGMTLSFLVVMRIIWGFTGTHHARFSGFALKPADLIAYFKGILAGDKKLWAGHNPATSWGTLAMMACVLGLGTTGYLMASGTGGEILEEVHEILANVFLVTVIAHLLGIVVHTVRHKDMIGLSMIDGRKAGVNPAEQISTTKAGFGYLLIVLVLAYGLNLYRGYDATTGQLNLFGTVLQLGHTEEGDGHDHEHGDDHGNEEGVDH